MRGLPQMHSPGLASHCGCVTDLCLKAALSPPPLSTQHIQTPRLTLMGVLVLFVIVAASAACYGDKGLANELLAKTDKMGI